MFSSSRDLRDRLHRTLAVVAVAAAGSVAAADAPWWTALPEAQRAAARHGELTLEQLGPLFSESPAHAGLVTAFRRLGAGEPPLGEALARMFAEALLSSQALRMHCGRDVYGASNKRTRAAVRGDFLAASTRPPLPTSLPP